MDGLQQKQQQQEQCRLSHHHHHHSARASPKRRRVNAAVDQTVEAVVKQHPASATVEPLVVVDSPIASPAAVSTSCSHPYEDSIPSPAPRRDDDDEVRARLHQQPFASPTSSLQHPHHSQHLPQQSTTPQKPRISHSLSLSPKKRRFSAAAIEVGWDSFIFCIRIDESPLHTDAPITESSLHPDV